VSTLSLALYCEGSTDQHFLPIVIQRTYESLAQEIRLERLKEVPAYKQFEEDLTGMMITLNVIPRK
jgi:hypothetical protein